MEIRSLRSTISKGTYMQGDSGIRRAVDLWRVLSIVAMVSLYATFAIANLATWDSIKRPVGLGLMLQEGLIAVLFIIRRQPKDLNRSTIAWLAAVIGTFGMLLARPHYDPVGGLGTVYLAAQVVGTVAAAASLAFLGRSFGLVAANRGIQVNGAYRLVRHPAYASYLIAQVGYVLENPSLWNVVVFLVATAAQVVRIKTEEDLLSADPAYVEYQKQVNFRLLPFIY